jgi:hypothetical protein
MLKVVFKGNKQAIRELEQEKDREMTRIAVDLLANAKSFTPIRSGRARRGWRLESTRNTKSAVNRVPYAARLDRGYSKQSPSGITRPTIRKTKRR